MRVNLDQFGVCISSNIVVRQGSQIELNQAQTDTNRSDKRIDSFCARARHSDVLPVPGL